MNNSFTGVKYTPSVHTYFELTLPSSSPLKILLETTLMNYHLKFETINFVSIKYLNDNSFVPSCIHQFVAYAAFPTALI